MKVRQFFLALSFGSVMLAGTANAATPETDIAALRAQVKLLAEKVEALGALVGTAPTLGVQSSNNLVLNPTQHGKWQVGQTLQLVAGDSISITTGGASLTLHKNGTVQIRGSKIVIDGQEVDIKSLKETPLMGKKIQGN